MGRNARTANLSSILYDPTIDSNKSITGRVMGRGVLDDISDRAYIVVDAIDGRSLFVKMGSTENIEDVRTGDIIEIMPNTFQPKPSDRTIDKVASKNGGVYSLANHMKADPSARPEFLKAHVRRLEALRRARLVMRQKDGSWMVPADYLDKAEKFEKRRAGRMPVKLGTLERGNIEQLTRTIGRTWLDQQLVQSTNGISNDGFGGQVQAALVKRRAFLVAQGILQSGAHLITKSQLDELERRDIEAAGKNLEDQVKKPYVPPPKSGRISGKLIERVDRPSGRYAIVERAKDFTLVPWRDVLEKRKGMEISGRIRSGQINWELGVKLGLEISY